MDKKFGKGAWSGQKVRKTGPKKCRNPPPPSPSLRGDPSGAGQNTAVTSSVLVVRRVLGKDGTGKGRRTSIGLRPRLHGCVFKSFCFHFVAFSNHCCRKEIVSLGGMTKKIFSISIIFLGYKSHFREKWEGAHAPPQPPGSYSTANRSTLDCVFNQIFAFW